MPIDAGIPLSVQMPHLLSPLEAQSQVGQVRAQQQEGMLRQGQMQLQQQQGQMNALSLSEGQLRQQQLERQVAGARAVAATVGKHLQPDGTVDHAAVAADLSQQGFPEQGDAWLAHATSTAEATSKLRDMDQQHTQKVIDTIAPLAKKLLDPKATAADFDAMLGQLAIPGMGSLKPEEAAGLRSKALELGPDGWRQVAASLVAQSTEAKTIRTVAPGGSVLQGSTPIYTAPNPAQEETTRHNQEMERISKLTADRAAAVAGETARHNRAMEQAANPFASLLGAAQSAGGAVPAGGPGTPTATSPAKGPTAPGATPEQTLGPNGLHGADFLKLLPPQVQGTVVGYASGKFPMPTGMSLSKMQPVLQMVTQYDPSFDAGNYNARNAFRTEVTGGKSGEGKAVDNLNTALQHAGKMSDLIEALGNGNYDTANSVVNWFKQRAGNTGPTNYNMVMPQMMKEVERLWRQTGGSTADLEKLESSLAPNMGIQAQREGLGQLADLIHGKLQSIEQKRNIVMGPEASKDLPIIFDYNKPTFDKILQRAGQAPMYGAGQTPPASTGAQIRRLSDGKLFNLAPGNPLPAGYETVK